VNSQRLTRFVVAGLLLALIGAIICGTLVTGFKASLIKCVALYAGFLFVQSVLLLLLTGVLVGQHDMRKWRIGIAGLLIATTMIALLFGVGSTFAEMMKPVELETEVPIRTGEQFIWTLVGLLIFSFIPLIFFLEALVTWGGRLVFPRRGRGA
jgi:hypothetical protein